ncbi:MAG: Flp family type IVb pilin [Acidobacteriaceae bacterium]
MYSKPWKLHATMQNLIMREEGQDLIEYALVVALVAFAATAGMNSLATGINTAFSNIAGVLGTYIT